MQFLTVQDGDFTINLNHIVSIDWSEGENEALVHMSNGQEFSLAEGDYDTLVSILTKNHI